MASISYSITNQGNTTSSIVTEGTSAPGAGDIEVRVNLAQGWSKLTVRSALDRIWRHIEDKSTNPIL